MLTKNANDTNRMLIIALFANNGLWKYMYMRIRKETGKFNNFLRFRVLCTVYVLTTV